MRILWVSNAMWVATGYGVQTKHVLPAFRDMGYEVAQSSYYGLRGSTIEYQGIPIYPVHNDVFGLDVIGGHVVDFEADLVVTLLDVWVLPRDYVKRVAPALWAPWFPVDAEPAPAAVVQRARLAHYPLVYSRFAERMMLEAGVPGTYIPHGVDCATFRPLDKARAREALGFPRDCFLAVMVAANKGWPSRKAFGEQLQAFAAFARANPELDAHLYLHTNATSQSGGVEFSPLLQSLGIAQRTYLVDQYQYKQGLPPEYLAHVYSAGDVCLMATMGEGFGIPIIEAQACGCPVITTDWTAMPELTVNGLATEPAQLAWSLTGAWRATPSVEAIAAALEEIASRDAEQRAIQTAAGVAHMRAHYDWPVVIEGYWKPFLARVADELPGRRDHPAPPPPARAPRHTYVVGGIPLDIEDEPGSFAARAVCREILSDYAFGVIPFQEGDVVVDVGAHVGLVAIWLAKKFQHLGLKVYAYEPDWTNFKRLTRNIEANEVAGQVFPFWLGVTADGRDLDLRGNRSENSGGLSAFVSDGEPTGTNAASTTLGAILAERGPVRLLKLDCEGAEHEVLQGLAPEYWPLIDHLRAEFHINDQLAAQGYDSLRLLKRCLEYLPPDRVRVKRIRMAE